MYQPPPKILVVSDDQEMLIWAAYLLCLDGYQVQTARDSVECMKMLDIQHPDMVVLDLHSPNISGSMMTTQVIRSQIATRDLPVLVYLGSPVVTIRAWSNESGATDYIETTRFPTDLLKRVKAVLSRVEEGALARTVCVTSETG